MIDTETGQSCNNITNIQVVQADDTFALRVTAENVLCNKPEQWNNVNYWANIFAKKF